MRSKIRRVVLEAVAFITAAALFLAWAGWICRSFLPERSSYGACWDMYLAEPEDSIDVFFLGASLTYCDIIPNEIYRQTGCRTYVVSAPVCTEATAYWYLKEALKTQHPKQVFVELASLFLDEYTMYGQTSVSYMPWSLNRIGAAFTSVDAEHRTGVLFPFYSFHDRWKEMDFRDLLPEEDEPDTWAGYTLLGEAKTYSVRWPATVSYQKVNLEKNLRYLEKIRNLCEEEGIEVAYFLSPRCNFYGPGEQKIIQDNLNGVSFRDYTDDFDSMNLSMTDNFYDSRHLNFRGAMKFTDWLCGQYGDTWRSFAADDDPAAAPVWEDRTEALESVMRSNGLL